MKNKKNRHDHTTNGCFLFIYFFTHLSCARGNWNQRQIRYDRFQSLRFSISTSRSETRAVVVCINELFSFAPPVLFAGGELNARGKNGFSKTTIDTDGASTLYLLSEVFVVGFRGFAQNEHRLVRHVADDTRQLLRRLARIRCRAKGKRRTRTAVS